MAGWAGAWRSGLLKGTGEFGPARLMAYTRVGRYNFDNPAGSDLATRVDSVKLNGVSARSTAPLFTPGSEDRLLN